MRWIDRIAAAALCGLLQACVTAPAASPAPIVAAEVAAAEVRSPVTILISIDAFSPDYLRKGNTPNLDALAAAGVQGTMRPSFPTLTFPNHEAIATGMRPDRSGVVAGVMYDARRPEAKFTNSDPAQATDPFWWDGAEPIWIGAEKAGVKTGVMFWPGLEAAFGGMRPGDWARYDGNYLGAQRLRTVLDWMRRPAETRPAFAMAYLDIVDKTGHKMGPNAPETLAVIRETDASIGTLVAGLKELDQPVNLIVVSDHGMQAVDPAKTLLTSTILPADTYRFAQWGPFAGIDATPGNDARVAAALLAPHPFAQCWRKEELPARFHYGKHPRVPQFICLAAPGGEIVPVPPTNKGDHGYDPDEPSMTALFLASGPAFRSGAAAPAKFDNVDIYPLLRRLIGLPPASGIDGSSAPFSGILVQ